jgi:hypothetical protein
MGLSGVLITQQCHSTRKQAIQRKGHSFVALLVELLGIDRIAAAVGAHHSAVKRVLDAADAHHQPHKVA